MKLMYKLRYEPDFDLQADNDLVLDWVAFSDGPDRAYLIHAYPHEGGEEQETVALWVLEDAFSRETLAAVLGAPEPEHARAQPWFVRWIKGGKLHVRCQRIGIDRGAHLLATLADYDILDREAQLFGSGQ